MDVLYVPRDIWGTVADWRRAPRRRAGVWLNDLVRRRRLYGPDGFIRGALQARFRVTERHWRRAAWPGTRFDAVLVSSKAGCEGQALERLLRRFEAVPKVLVIEHDNASVMPDDAVLDRFDLVLKREPFCDRDRYAISAPNKAKIRPTMLSCPLVQVRDGRPKRWTYADTFGDPAPVEPAYDVSFIGADTDRRRVAICDHLAQQSFRAHLGIKFKRRPKPEEAEQRARLAMDKLDRWGGYAELIRRSAVNLALEGYGQFTHRHLEIWALGGFMLSSPTIREIELPHAAHVEQRHYVAFDDLDDLVDKVEHYRRDAAARDAVAAEGLNLFKELYDFQRHGRHIEHWLREVIAGHP